jgi:hypothetical protein
MVEIAGKNVAKAGFSKEIDVKVGWTAATVIANTFLIAWTESACHG